MNGSRKQLLPWLVAVAFFMESLDATILNTAVPTIARALMRGIHEAFMVLGSFTIASALVFRSLQGDDGSAVSQHKAILPTG